jgi:hypothetical protein
LYPFLPASSGFFRLFRFCAPVRKTVASSS